MISIFQQLDKVFPKKSLTVQIIVESLLLFAVAARSIGIMCHRNVVCAHPAAGRTRTDPSAGPWSAAGKLYRAAALSAWTAAPGPLAGFVSLRRLRTCIRTVCADGARTDPERSWHSPRTRSSAAPSPGCSTWRRQPALRLSLPRDKSSGTGTPAVDSSSVSMLKRRKQTFYQFPRRID